MAPSATKCTECGRVTIRVSWSGLRTHEECRQRSHLARTHKLATINDKRVFFPGTVTDRVVRNWLNDDPEHNLGAMPDMVATVIDFEKAEMVEKEEGVVRWKDGGDKARVKADCIEAVTKIEPHLIKYVLPFEYEPDKSFEAPVTLRNPHTGDDVMVVLNGKMDILVRDDRDRWWVWDVKHTRDDGYWRKTIAQLGFYDLAVELMFGKPTIKTGLMQPLCKQQIKAYTPSAESRAQLMARIHAMAMDIHDDIRTPREDMKLCGWCPTKHACVKFLPVFDKKGRKRVAL